MSWLKQLWALGSEFIAAWVSSGGHALALASPTIEIVAEDERQLVLRCGARHVVLNRRYKTVKADDHVLARFGDIQFVDIAYQPGDEQADAWRVCLNLGGCTAVDIGTTTDDVSASIAAAHLGTFTGKTVRTL
jgi:hypothetical protein